MISQQPKTRRTLHKPSVQDEVNKQSLLSLYSFFYYLCKKENFKYGEYLENIISWRRVVTLVVVKIE